MIQKVGIKTQIYLTEEQKIQISKLQGCCRKIYNLLLNYCEDTYKNFNYHPSYKQINQEYLKLKHLPEYFYLNESHSKVEQQVLRHLNQAYKNFFKHIADKPIFKKKNANKQTCTFPNDAIGNINGNRINLIKGLQNILFKCSDKDMSYINKHKKEIISCILTSPSSGKYYLTFVFNKNIQEKEQVDTIIGIDLGIKDLIITSDGEKINNKKFYTKNKRIQKQLKHYQRLMQKKRNYNKKSKKYKQDKYYKSNNYINLNKKYARLWEKLTNKKKNYLHQITTKLINENQVICLEDLNVKGMLKNHKLSKAINELGFYELKRQLLYKSLWYGKTIQLIDRFYPSSKLCNNCGYKKKNLKLNDREWVCPICSQKHDRDINAAINILNEGYRLYCLN